MSNILLNGYGPQQRILVRGYGGSLFEPISPSFNVTIAKGKGKVEISQKKFSTDFVKPTGQTEFAKGKFDTIDDKGKGKTLYDT